VGVFSFSTGQVTRHHWIPVIHKRPAGRAYPLIGPISGDHSQASYRATTLLRLKGSSSISLVSSSSAATW
jgi:hypothetical protein